MNSALRNYDLGSAYRTCAAITRRAARNFYLAFLLLPPDMRRSIYAAYAFSRRVDDIADGSAQRPRKEALLNRCHDDVSAAAAGQSRHWDPVTLALSDAMHRHQIPAEYLHELIEGMEMDLDARKYSRFDDLFTYCYRAASLVGLICIEIFGYQGGDRARSRAADLGIALQLTNILRDVGEDAAMGRIYLPAEDLELFGVSEEQLLSGHTDDAFRAMMRFQAARAREYFDKGRELIPMLDPAGRACVQVLGAVYSGLLERIEARDFDVFSSRVRVPGRTKVRMAMGAWVGAAPSW